jgi:hypothetical protein
MDHRLMRPRMNSFKEERPLSFGDYIRHQYARAHQEQLGIRGDPRVVEVFADTFVPADLESWMRSYGLFQGITGPDRLKIVTAIGAWASSRRSASGAPQTRAEIEQLYGDLFHVIYAVLPRSWISATSKVLWAMYPRDMVIYDDFVHTSMTVLQCVERCLAPYRRVGRQPAVSSAADIPRAVAFYMNVQDMVKELASSYASELAMQKRKQSTSYPYDIRIMDKLLWMMGNPGWAH